MAQFRVEAIEKFEVKTVYYVDAETAEEAEEMCKSGSEPYLHFENLGNDDEWVETLEVREMTDGRSLHSAPNRAGWGGLE